MHLQACTPKAVLLSASRQEAPLLLQLLGQGADVVRLEPAASADVPDASVVGVTGIFMHVPSGQDSGLETCGRQDRFLTRLMFANTINHAKTTIAQH